MNMKQIADALRILQKAPDGVVESILADNSLEKAATALTAKEHVPDRWEQGEINRKLTTEEIVVGPELESAGNGATEAAKIYSNPAPQNVTMVTAEYLARMIAPVMSASKAQSEAIVALIESVKATNASLAVLVAKAEEADDEDDEEEDEEESEVVEINASKAKSFVSTSPLANRQLIKSFVEKAKDYLARAKKAGDDAVTMADADERKACRAKARKFTKAASVYLNKAASIASFAKIEDLRKSVLKLASKADIDVVQEEEEDEEDEEEKAKAKEPAKGNQDDKAEPDGHNQDDGAAKAVSDAAEKLEAALKGVGMLTTDVKGMMDTIMGSSRRTAPLVPDFAKAADNVADIETRIADLEESGQLSVGDALAARDIIGKSQMVKRGLVDKSVLTDRISKASHSVQMLFRSDAA